MDYYASKAHNAFISVDEKVDSYQTASPSLQGPGESGLCFSVEEEVEDKKLDSAQQPSTPVQHIKSTPMPTQSFHEKPSNKRPKKQKITTEPVDGFHEKYLQLKKEEIDRFAAIEEKKLEDPYSINKCITALEGLDGLQTSDILMASDIFQSKDNREIFLSYSSDALRLAWITREIARTNPNYQL